MPIPTNAEAIARTLRDPGRGRARVDAVGLELAEARAGGEPLVLELAEPSERVALELRDDSDDATEVWR